VVRPGTYSTTIRLPEDERPFHLKDAGRFFRRRWRAFALGVGAAVGLAALITLIMPPTYESNVSILVERPERMGDGSVFSVLDRLGRGGTKETEVRLLTSRRVVEPVAERLHLHVELEQGGRRTTPEKLSVAVRASRNAAPGDFGVRSDGRRVEVFGRNSAPSDTLASGPTGRFFTFEGISLHLPEEREVEFVLRVHPFSEAVTTVQDDRLSARVVHRDADLVELTCTGATPMEARELCSEVVESYLTLRTDLQQTEAVAASGFLEDQVARLNEQLAAAEDSLEAYSRLATVVAPEQQAQEEVVQYSRLRAEKEALEAERLALAGLLDEIDEGGGERSYRDLASFPTFLRNETVTRLVQGLIDLDNQRSELALRRADVNPDLSAIDARIAQLEGQLHSLASSYEAALRTQIASLDRNLIGVQGRLGSLPTQRMEFERLQRRASLLEDLYRDLQARYQEAQVAAAVNLPSVRLVDPASLPILPASPRLRLNLMAGLAMGLVLGLLLALFREETDNTVQGLENLEADTGLAVIAMLPHFRGASRPRALVRAGEPPPKEPHHIRAEDHEALVEGLRSLLAELRLASRQGKWKSIAIASTSRGEGKTLVASNLAFVAALDGQRVLLLDGDLRGGSVARTFNLPEGALGLSDVITSSTEPADVWRRLHAQAGGELWILPAGTGRQRGLGARMEAGLARTIQEGERAFDLVVVDGPPLGVIGDAAILAASVDGVVLVVRDGYTDREALAFTLQRLRRTNARVLGIVFNDSEVPSYYGLYEQTVS
jgi:capsular exopolysaccharide synthesis family protein